MKLSREKMKRKIKETQSPKFWKNTTKLSRTTSRHKLNEHTKIINSSCLGIS